MSKVLLKRTGQKPVDISEEDFTREMAEYIYRHWEETRSQLVVNHGEHQFVVVPMAKRNNQ
jgi:hypothetical protein